ncbi:MAG: hypothetical protein E7020_00750 [Alphaproteobacteria bacterium]|nr:hypothetical protein [Alphaproteobacteria bacterium]
MRIYCPNCDVGYDIDEVLIRDKMRQVKCSNCGSIFDAGSLKTKLVDNLEADTENPFEALSAVMREDEPIDLEQDIIEPIIKDNEVIETVVEVAVDDKTTEIEKQSDETIVSDDNVDEEDTEVDLENIFERLSEHTAGLIDREKKLPLYGKMWLQIKNVLGFHFKVKWSYIFIALAVFVLLSMYNNRYQIVRELPFFNGFYRMLGIKAKIPGEGLEFQNVSWNFVADKENTRLEIKGFIYNLTDKDIDVPTIHIEILDKNTSLLQSSNRNSKQGVVSPNTKIPLSLTINNPAPTAKYVYLTFIDKD